ncbi:tetrahydromethanopterin S-methyltransferase, MtrH subunit [Methanosalsum zhilinae DSM 4017]|uniref:Tetrahydromethanopterin S-methyltransferase, MtrH subunit n=1 Tax=Methanosalsum zhilinae (strain DSM 4017 / NBRC 107636 / OCM 62 / WeN5) TaxID=679901 RepID=F7XKL4_METZD|nr:tetrahydromethanopterin S-methyltransferase subunit H [Methanosalsum zhilinae]AEH60617.1 tetrahydromethanopterin S-methyltransferase, MtrH subunit [Methanosalsum zhilinae DSM 4017]
MFRFQKEQEICNIAGTKIGGQPGELPTVVAGTIFYTGHKIIEDPDKGIFDRNTAEKLINNQESNSDETGIPHIIHIFSNTLESMHKYIDFICDVSDAPFIVDSSEPEVRTDAALYTTETGLADRTIYNSLNMSTEASEIECLKLSDVDSSIILGFNAIDSSLSGRMRLLEDGGGILDKGLVEIANYCGISNKLIDPSITPMGSGAGIALRMSLTAKARWGHPVGSGIHNAPSSWSWLQNKRKEDPLKYKICDIGSIGMQIVSAGDFILYGPMENAPYVFPLVAMGDIMVCEAIEDMGIEHSDNHPINRLV